MSATIGELSKSPNVILFIDEADTAHHGIYLFQSFIAAMNGEEFSHEGRQNSFSEKNLIIFYAMSSGEKKWREDPDSVPQKWIDFTERVPADHWIEPPSLGSSAGERVFRAIGLINGINQNVEYAEANALFYIGWKEWRTTREMELALRRALAVVIPPTLKLSDVAVSPIDVELAGRANRTLLAELGHQGGLWTFGGDRRIRIKF
jgi:hypothetical protein